MKVLLGTNNLDKLKEFIEIFNSYNIDIKIVSLKEMDHLVEEPIEDGNSFYENAVIKAKYYYECYKMPVLTDDSGICVNSLNGLPGIYSARYSSLNNENSDPQKNNEKLLEDLKGINDRSCYYECSVVFYDGENLVEGHGYCHGEIIDTAKGSNGFGYDPIFYIKKYGKTVSELDRDVKNSISHRYNAVIDLIKKLDFSLKK